MLNAKAMRRARRALLTTTVVVGLAAAIPVSAVAASGPPTARAACVAKGRPAAVTVRPVSTVSATRARFVVARDRHGVALYRCVPRRRLVARLSRGAQVPAAAAGGRWTAWVSMRRGRLQVERRSPGGTIRRTRLSRAQGDAEVAVTSAGDVVLLRQRGLALVVQRWSTAGRLGVARLDRAIGRLTRDRSSAVLWAPDASDVLLDAPRPDDLSDGQSITNAGIVGLHAPTGSRRCASAVPSRTRREDSRWVVQESDLWLRACDKRTGRRRYLEVYSPLDREDDEGLIRSVQFRSLDLVGDTALVSRDVASSHYGEGGSSYRTIDLATGRRSAAGGREFKPLYFPTGTSYAHLGAVGACVDGIRTWTPEPSVETLVLADGFTVQQDVFGAPVNTGPNVTVTKTTRASITYTDATGSHDVRLVQDPRDPAPGAVRVTPTSITVRTETGPATITPVPFGAPSPTAAASC